MCVCVCVRACVMRILRILTLESLSTLCVSFFLSFCLTYVFIADDISISMYIMSVIPCLLSALSRRVGAFDVTVFDPPEVTLYG